MADDLRALLGEPDTKPTTQTDLVSLLGEPDVKKKEEPVVGVGESGVSPSLSSTPDREFLQDTEVIVPELPQSKETISFQAEQKKEEVPNFMGLLTEGYQEQPVGVVKSISEGLSKAERPIEDKFASYVDRKRTELTGGVQLPNPLAAQTPEQYNQALSEYTRILRENPMAEKEDNKITAIRMLIDKTKETDQVVGDYSQRTIAGNLGTGLKKGLEDYGRGYFELFDRLKQNDAIKDLNVKLEALDRGENVSFDEGEKILAQALVDNGNKIKELEALSPSAFNIGKMAGESLGFTGEFLLTGGIGAGASKAITKGVVAKAAEGAAISKAKKIGVGLAAKMAQTGIQVGAMPTFYKGIAEDVSMGENFGKSLFENYYKTFSENFTERIFLKNPWNKATVGAVDNFMGRLGVNMHTEKGLVGILASTAEETAEEKIGELMTAPLDYNNFDKFWNDYWNVKKNAELIGSIAVMTAPAGLVSYGVKKYDDVQLNRIGKLLPSGIRSEIDQVLDDQKLTLKEQYDLVGRIVEDHAKDRTLGDRPAEAAGNIIRYVEKKTKSNVVSAVEDRAQTPTVGTMEEVSTEDQAKVDYLESKGVKIPDGSTMAVVNDLYEKEKQKEPSVVDDGKMVVNKLNKNEVDLLLNPPESREEDWDYEETVGGFKVSPKKGTNAEKLAKASDKAEALSFIDPNAKSVRLKHGTTSGKADKIISSGFNTKAPLDPQLRNFDQFDNLTNEGVFFSKAGVIHPTWDAGRASRMPEYDAYVEAEVSLKNALFLDKKNESEFGIDGGKITPESIARIKELGYDVIVSNDESYLSGGRQVLLLDNKAIIGDMLKKTKEEVISDATSEQKQKDEVVSVAEKQVVETVPNEETISPVETISTPVETRSSEEPPIVSPEQKEGLKQIKQDVVGGVEKSESVDRFVEPTEEEIKDGNEFKLIRGNVYSSELGLGQSKNLQGMGIADALPSMFGEKAKEKGRKLDQDVLDDMKAKILSIVKRIKEIENKGDDRTVDEFKEMDRLYYSKRMMKDEIEQLEIRIKKYDEQKKEREDVEKETASLGLVWLTSQKETARSYAEVLSGVGSGVLGERDKPSVNYDIVTVKPNKIFDLTKLSDETGGLWDDGANTKEIEWVIGMDLNSLPEPPETSFQLFRGRNAKLVVEALRRKGYDMVRMKEGSQDNFVLIGGEADVEQQKQQPTVVEPQKEKEYKEKKANDKSPQKGRVYVPENVERQLTDDGEGNFVFMHISAEKRTTLSPSEANKKPNALSSPEELAAKSSVGGVIDLYTASEQVERQVHGEEHTVKVPKEKVYHAQSDPLNLLEEARARFEEKHKGKAFGSNLQVVWLTKIANEHGFDIVVTDWSNGVIGKTTKDMTPEATETKTKERVLGSNIGDTVEMGGDVYVLADVNDKFITIKSAESTRQLPVSNFKKKILWFADKRPAPKQDRISTKDTLKEKISNGVWGMLTGENPLKQELTPEENKKLNKKAVDWLKARGYDPIAINGKYGNEENSFFVENLTKEDAIAFAKEFNQDSVATNEGLVYQDGSMNPIKKGQEVIGGAFRDNFSTININGEDVHFSVNYDFDKTIKQVKQQENGKETSDEAQGRKEGRQEELLTDQEEKKVVETAGVKPKNLRDVYRAGREIFGLNKAQALAQAIIVDRVVAKAAKNSGKTKQQIYSEIEFRKDADAFLKSKLPTQQTLQGKRGATVSLDSASIIYVLTDPNVSTPLHEIAHVYERYMLPSEKAAVLAWTGHKVWSVETSEKFARGFERYLSEGVAPTEKLKAVFERLKTWLTDIYNGIKQSEIDVELNTEMKRLYDSILTGKKYTPSKEKVATKAQEVPKKTYKDVDDLLFQDLPKTEPKQKANNKPITLYHSTSRSILGQFRVRGKNNSWGVFFAPTAKYSQNFGDITYKVKINPQNTKRYDDQEVRRNPFFNITEDQFNKYLQDGYDSLAWYRNGKLTEFVVLNPDIIQDRNVLFQDVQSDEEKNKRTERHTKALEKLISHLESEKSEDVAKEVNDYLKAKGNPISQELIDKVLKEKGYAQGTRTTTEEAGQQAQGVVEGEKRRIRLGDDAKDRVETQKRKRVKEVGENESRDSRLGIRWAWGNGYSEEAQAKFREQGLYSYKPESHSEVEEAARSIVENNSEEDALRTMRDNNVSRRIRTAIGILLIDKMDARVNDLKSKGKDKEANDVVSDIKDTMKFIQDEFATESGRDESFFGSNMVMTRLGGYTLARMAQLGMDASRTAEMGRKRFKRVEKLATEELGKARKEAVDATIKKVVPQKQKNVDVKIQEIRKKRSSLIDQWKKARENKENTYSVIIPGLTQVDIEYGGRIAATYIEEGIYQTDKLIKKLKKVFDQVGIEVKDSDLKKLIPETYEGVPFSQYQESKELEEAADMLAQRIFGDVIDKKAPPKDPIKIMVDTLFSKFRETQLDRKKTEKMSDIEKLSLAIKESKEYAKAWSEAKDYAINKITEDKNLSEGAKAIAIERVEKAYKNATELVFSDKLIKDLIRKEISERNMDVAEIVRDHYDRRGAIKEDLKKSLIEKAGLTDSEARILSDAVDSTFETLLADRVSKVVKKFTEKGKKKATAKQLKGADQVLYFTRIGAFDNAEFREAFADMWGIPKLTEEDVNYIIDQHKKIQRIKGEAMRYEEKQKLLAYIANLQGMDWNELIDGIWYANVLSGSGTQLKNLLDANTAALVEPMLIAGTSPFKRARLRNAVARAVTGRAWANLKYTLETGNHPFDFGQETPKLSKRVLDTKEPLVKNKLQWSAIKALSRYQNVFFDLMMANDAFAGTLAYESMIDVIVTDAAYSKARKEAGRKLTKKEKEALNRKIDELLRITPEDQEIINNIVDQESEEYKKIQAEEGKKQTGYSDRQRIQRKFELMDEMRPVDMVEDARRISLEAVGNINPYGTLGWVMGVVTNVANNFGATFSKPVIVKSGSKFVLSAHPTDKVTIKPFQKVVPFTRIITNLATRNLNWNPITAGIRASTSKYGTFVLNKKGASGKFIREMSPEERKIIARKIFYTAAIASLGYALTGGDDPEDGLIRITGNGTGNFEKNKQLRQAGWKPWSIQIGDFSISYQYIYPLNMILSAIGWARDQQLYNDSDTPFALLYAQGLVFSIGQVLFSTPMSGISSAFDTIGSLVFEGVDSFTDKLAKMTSMIGGGFVSPRVFDDIDKLFGMASDRADIEGVTLSEKFADRVPFVGRNFAGKVEAIDLFGDNIPLQSPAEAVMSVKVRGKNVELTKWMVEDIGYFRPMPSFKETTFIVMEKDGSINKARKLVEGNDDEGAFWTEYNKTVGSIFKEKAMAIKTLDRDKEETKKLLKDAWDKSRELAIVEMYKRSTERPLESTQIE